MNNQNLDSILHSFDTIQLSQLSNNLKLMNRIDTKYLTNEIQLLELLPHLVSKYNIQVVESDVRNSRYQTFYYDTKDLEMYFMHHNYRSVRNKIRIRKYIESDISFFEIKTKDNHKRTTKQRIQIFNENIYNNNEIKKFLEENSKYKVSELYPYVSNEFNRITLIDKDMSERLTIDSNIRFSNINTNMQAALPNIVILELKQLSSEPSYIKYLLKEFDIYRNSISKYCIGSILTNKALKHNSFKNKMHFINKLSMC